MTDLKIEQNVSDKLTDAVIDAIRHLAAFTATESLSDVWKARTLITNIARHEVCGTFIADKHCGYGCYELAIPMWKVTLHIQRALTIDKYQDGDDE